MKSNKNVLIFCGILLTAFLLTKMMSDDIKVTSLLKQSYESKNVEVVEGDNFIKYVSDVKDAHDVKWIDDNVVSFKGLADNNKTELFQFDYNSKKLSQNHENGEAFYKKEFKENIELIVEIDGDSYLIYSEAAKKKGLFHVRKDKESKLLSDSIKLNDQLLVKVSGNKKKVAFYDTNDKKIKVYNFSSKKVASIDKEIGNEALKNFENNVSFSYEAGYLAVANINKEDFKESYFSVFGADSGKVYAEEILGINPSWGKENLTVAFSHMENNSVTNTKDVSVENLASDRVGFYNLKTRKIKYTQKMGKGYKVIRPAIWKDNSEALIVVGKYVEDDNKYYFNKIYSYGLKNNTLSDLQSYFKDINSTGEDYKFDLIENNIHVSSLGNDEKNNIRIINLNKRSVKEYNNLQEFTSKKEGKEDPMLYKYLDSNKLLYVLNNGVYITDFESNYLKYRASEAVTGIYESPSKDKLLILSNNGEKLELAIINL
ncbi:hypothetical protein R9X47_29045 [Wukongibacter baidiensis]|uniref:hypothetical protein n=1 Tax=Wukongibacter baidiensis TaxID=1723361 RepID=UPI003D7FD47E